MADDPGAASEDRPSPTGPSPRGVTVSPAGSPRQQAASAWLRLLQCCIAEIVGTYILVLIGINVVAASLLAGAHVGVWQVAIITGIGVSLAIYATGAISGAHINPAVSLSFAIFRPREFPLCRLLPYWLAQMAGAVLAGATLLALYNPFIQRFEVQHGLERGEPGSQLSAMVFTEYFPNPALLGVDEAARALISPAVAAVVEGIGTCILMLIIFALADRRTERSHIRVLAPLVIGLTVAVLIGVMAPLTMGGWNPARDFGPRIVAFLSGWGTIAIPGPSSGFWVYIVGPLIGGPVGAAIYDFVLRPGLPSDGAAKADELSGPPP